MTPVSRVGKITPFYLTCRILRYNAGCCLLGCVQFGIAVVLWAATVYATSVVYAILRSPGDFRNIPSFPWTGFDSYAWTSTALTVVLIAGLGFWQRGRFFVLENDNLPFEDGISGIRPARISGFGILLAVVCCAPFWTLLSLYSLGACLSPRQNRLRLACTIYAYLDGQKGWSAFPKLESQRDAVRLLVRLNLVRFSKRFGKTEIKKSLAF